MLSSCLSDRPGEWATGGVCKLMKPAFGESLLVCCGLLLTVGAWRGLLFTAQRLWITETRTTARRCVCGGC